MGSLFHDLFQMGNELGSFFYQGVKHITLNASHWSLSARKEFKQLYKEFIIYLKSNEFETDLDTFADKIGLTWDRFGARVNDRNFRVYRKCHLIYERCSQGVFKASALGAAVGTVFGAPTRGAMLFGTLKAGDYLFLAILIFGAGPQFHFPVSSHTAKTHST